MNVPLASTFFKHVRLLSRNLENITFVFFESLSDFGIVKFKYLCLFGKCLRSFVSVRRKIDIFKQMFGYEKVLLFPCQLNTF